MIFKPDLGLLWMSFHHTFHSAPEPLAFAKFVPDVTQGVFEACSG
jgi:hypothetical protein